MKRVSLTFLLINALAITGLFRATPPTVTVTAASIQRWSITTGHYALNFFGDGTLLAARPEVVLGPQVPGGNGVPAIKINPATGAVFDEFYSPDVRTTIRLSQSPGEQDWMIGGYENRPAVRKDGTYVKDLFPLGCCNVPRYPFAYDHVNDRAYLAANSGIGYVHIPTDFRPDLGPTANFFGMVSLANADTVYTAGQQGNITRTDPVSGFQWTVNVDSGSTQPAAIAADGSVIVTTGYAHFHSNTVPGRLTRVMSDGTVAWNNLVNAVTPPVIGSNGLIFVGTQAAPVNESGAGAIEAYDLTGTLVWSVPVDGLPNDLLVGDDGAVYAGIGSFSSGSIYSLGQDLGEVRQVITNVPGAWEIVLRAGLLYASGTSITALPVAANNYDLGSPWPVRYHDNQRTSNRTAPILTPARIPALDNTPPTIAIVQPTNSMYLLNQAVTVQFSCDDEESGVATCNGTQANGSMLNTSAPGSYSFTVNATDVAGNSSQQVVHYTVGYGVLALYDQTKAHKSGSTVPVKIRLIDANGNNVSSASTVVHAISVIQTSTMASTVLDDAGNANPDFNFRYDAGLNGYIFNLKTRGYTTGSYVLNFVAGGGPTVYSVGFQVRQ